MACDGTVVGDEEPLEEGLVDLPAGALVGFDVGGVEVADEVECCFEMAFNDVELQFKGAVGCLLKTRRCGSQAPTAPNDALARQMAALWSRSKLGVSLFD